MHLGREHLPVRVVHFAVDGPDFRTATNLLNPPTLEIAELYRELWWIERLFRFVKSHLGCSVTVWDEAACVDRPLASFLAAHLVAVITGVPGPKGFEPHAEGPRQLQAVIECAAAVGIDRSP